jgi:hypothetical protein
MATKKLVDMRYILCHVPIKFSQNISLAARCLNLSAKLFPAPIIRSQSTTRTKPNQTKNQPRAYIIKVGAILMQI